MREIKKITKGNYTLTHSWYLDTTGMTRNAFDLFNETTRTHSPFFGLIRVSNYDRNTLISGDDVSPYTDDEYEQMFDQELTKIKSYE